MLSLRYAVTFCLLAATALTAVTASAAPAQPAAVWETAREIPIAAQVDVVVVGGTSGAVSAAAAAAAAGAKVFVVAPRTYLGEDLAGTLRLWLEEGETPTTDLARQVFADATPADTTGMRFTYQADLPSIAPHVDGKPFLLSDGRIGNVQKESVQYDGDVTLTADLGDPKDLKSVAVVFFNRADDFEADSVAVATSLDRKAWKEIATVPCEPSADETRTARAPVADTVRYVRLAVKRKDGSRRLLVAEVKLEPGKPEAPAPAATTLANFKPPRPLHVKAALDKALLAAKVDFLYGCYATDILTDAQGKPCGVVMANRAGRQAVLAKVIIDATEHAAVARMAGATMHPFSAGTQTVRWTVIAPQAKAGLEESARRLPWPVTMTDIKGVKVLQGKTASWLEYTLSLPLADDSWPAWAAMEQAVRDKAYDPSQLYTADVPLVVPPASIKAAQPATGAWPGADKLPLEALRPAGVERLWVLSGAADLPREAAEKLMRPVAYMEVGRRVGQAAAAEAVRLASPAGAKAAPRGPMKASAAAPGEVHERLAGLRPLPAPAKLPQEAGPLPVLGRYDVVVVGGGTAGAPAGIAAARKGARTLVLEYLHGLGGVSTIGMIGKYWYGNRVGFTATVPDQPIEIRMEHYRKELRKAGAEIWFGVLACGAVTEGGRVTGVVVVTPQGRGVVLAKAVIDATGNADVAIAAGAPYVFVEDFFAVQASHRPLREVGASYMNGNIPSVDDADPINIREVILGIPAGPFFDRSPLVDTRERRRIVGDYTLDWIDQMARRTFTDSIVLGQSDYDSHGYQIHPFFMLRPARPPGNYKAQFYSYVPYRCLLPQGLEGILVTGLGASAHRDAVPIIRMQPDLHNQGYAAGYAAAMAVQAGTTPRKIDVKALQKHLVEIKNLAPSVLTDRDSFPLPPEKVAAAIQRVTKDFDGLEVLLAQPADSLPLLRQAYAAAKGPEQLAYAQILGIMGDATGLPALEAEAKRLIAAKALQLPRDEKGQLVAGPQYVPSEGSRVIWALGGTGDKRAVAPLLAMLPHIDPSDGPKARAMAVSLGRLADPAAAEPLAAWMQTKEPEPNIRVLIAACALYRCGDRNGLAKAALEGFTRSANGPFSLLAWQVLQTPAGAPPRK